MAQSQAASQAIRPGSPLSSSTMRRRDAAFGMIMVLPSAVILAVVLGWPVLRLFYLSMHFLQLTSPERGVPFIGLENFAIAFQDPELWASFRRTFVFTFSTILVELMIGISTAMVLNRVSQVLNVVRGLLLLPWMLMWPVVAVIWRWIFDGQYGIVNYILVATGLADSPIQWLGTPGVAMGIVIWVSAWREFPIAMIFTLAGLQAIDDTYFEAARIDGATKWQEFWRIAFPLLTPTILLILLLRTTFALRTFDLVYTLTGGGPAGTTHVIGTYIYERAFLGYDLGMGSALSVLLLGVTLIISTLYVVLLPRQSR